jgi:hypothetical protein
MNLCYTELAALVTVLFLFLGFGGHLANSFSLLGLSGGWLSLIIEANLFIYTCLLVEKNAVLELERSKRNVGTTVHRPRIE